MSRSPTTNDGTHVEPSSLSIFVEQTLQTVRRQELRNGSGRVWVREANLNEGHARRVKRATRHVITRVNVGIVGHLLS